jgi:hypothetical protein
MKIPKSIQTLDSILNRSALWELIVNTARAAIAVNLAVVLWKWLRVGVMVAMVACFLGRPYVVQAQLQTNDPNYGMIEGLLYVGLAGLTSAYSVIMIEISKIGSDQDVSNRLYWAGQVSTNAWGGIAGIEPWPPGTPPINFPPIVGAVGTNLPGLWVTTNLDMGGNWIYVHGYTNTTETFTTNTYTLPKSSTLFFGLFASNPVPASIQSAVIPWTQNSGSTTTLRKENETYDTETIGLPVGRLYSLPPDRNAAQRATDALRKAQDRRKSGG